MADKFLTVAEEMLAIMTRQQTLLIMAGETIDHIVSILPPGRDRVHALEVVNRYRLAVEAIKEAIEPIDEIFNG